MKLTMLRGVIDRRLLVTYRIDPAALSKVLPNPFRPKLLRGVGMGGICLIRLKHVRPRLFPAIAGIGSENVAHRIAVEWDDARGTHEGVYIPRRDTSSLSSVVLGGRLFPGVLHHARFDVDESADRFHVCATSADGQVHVEVACRRSPALPATSIFRSLSEASELFERGSVGCAATSDPGVYEITALRSFTWQVEPLAIETAVSSFLADPTRFPHGSVELDSAILMRNIEHEWLAQEPLRIPA